MARPKTDKPFPTVKRALKKNWFIVKSTGILGGITKFKTKRANSKIDLFSRY